MFSWCKHFSIVDALWSLTSYYNNWLSISLTTQSLSSVNENQLEMNTLQCSSITWTPDKFRAFIVHLCFQNIISWRILFKSLTQRTIKKMVRPVNLNYLAGFSNIMSLAFTTIVSYQLVYSNLFVGVFLVSISVLSRFLFKPTCI